MNCISKAITLTAILLALNIYLVFGQTSASLNAGEKIAFVYSGDLVDQIYTLDNLGNINQITFLDENHGRPACSHLGNQIAFPSSGIYTMSLSSLQPLKISNNVLDNWPSWSPDDTTIVFYQLNEGNNLWIMNADGSNRHMLTSNSGTDDLPMWSPTGNEIAFVSRKDGNEEIYVISADGINQTRLTTNNTIDLNPVWSPDGGKIAFTTYQDGNAEIYTMNADGTKLSRLTTNSAYDDYPAWSPDGSRIAFVSNRRGKNDLYLMDTNGNNVQQITDKGDISYACWLVTTPTSTTTPTSSTTPTPGALPPTRSPTGTSTPNATAGNQTTVTNGRIAFVSNMDGDREIYTINPDGSDLRQLTFNDTDDGYPTWSPDGSRIAYVHEADVFIMNADGSNSVKIENTFGARYLDWSPDGNSLAFSESEDIVVIDLSNLTTTRLTNTPEVLDESPTWSPDGTQIVFSSSGDNPVPFALDGVPFMELYVVDWDGNNLAELVNDVGSSLGSLNWASDNYLIYSVYSIPVDAIFSYGVDDRSKSRLSNPSNNAWGPSLSPDETKIAFLQDSGLAIMNRDGSNVTTILTIDGNITSLDWQPVLVVNPSSTPSPNPTTSG